MAEKATFRELFIDELADIRGGEPVCCISMDPCKYHYTTLACGEEYGPCAPSGC
jgi:hypothetical protein